MEQIITIVVTPSVSCLNAPIDPMFEECLRLMDQEGYKNTEHLPFKAVRGLMGCVQSRELGARALRLPRFILLRSFIDTLLMVSILDIVYDCHL